MLVRPEIAVNNYFSNAIQLIIMFCNILSRLSFLQILCIGRQYNFQPRISLGYINPFRRIRTSWYSMIFHFSGLNIIFQFISKVNHKKVIDSEYVCSRPVCHKFNNGEK